jgi:hypothetical protein
MTGDPGAATAVAGVEVLSKPIDLDDLGTRLERLCRRG